MKKLLYIFVVSFFIAACDNPIVVTPGTQGNNVVTGIEITSEFREIIYRWGSPNFPEPIRMEPEEQNNNEGEEVEAYPEYFRMAPPYPNPADGNMNIEFSLPRTSDVKIWMETAYLDVRNKEGFQSLVLFEQKDRIPGWHQVQMSEKSVCSGGRLEQGFFRVFIQVNQKHTLWRDIYIGGVREKAPTGLRNFMSTHICSDHPDFLR